MAGMPEAPATAEPAKTFSVPGDHPCLAGHFPGAPVVPGVVVLDHVLELLSVPAGQERALAWVKFLRPLLPGQRAEVSAVRDGAELKFTVSHAGATLVRGAVTLAAPPDTTGDAARR